MKSSLLQRVKDLLCYDPKTGLFTWRSSTLNHIAAGTVAGHLNKRGYIEIQIDGTTYYAHRLAWFFVYGAWPKKRIDHEDRNGQNNAILNLREATNSQNLANSARYRTNTSGIKGVTKLKTCNRWLPQISFQGKRVYLGLFKSKRAAGFAYQQKSKELFGEFSRT